MVNEKKNHLKTRKRGKIRERKKPNLLLNLHKFNKNITFPLKILTNKQSLRYNNREIKDKLLKNDEPT